MTMIGCKDTRQNEKEEDNKLVQETVEVVPMQQHNVLKQVLMVIQYWRMIKQVLLVFVLVVQNATMFVLQLEQRNRLS